ncbi:unnamed protein product [Mycena citricolor]|uniref:Uncharacterized protein n=1 Tax=Mycena citricolor TaxID=2018698 RepID=A0AAD2Q537_9AGAR|nr:unnamed protein product [Mycena citricolor]
MTDLNRSAGTQGSVPASLAADASTIATLLHIIDALTVHVQHLQNTSSDGLAPLATAQPAPHLGGGIQSQGPWVVGTMYNVVPTGPLAAMPPTQSASFPPETIWYAVTRGHYVGITTNNSVAVAAVTGASRSNMGGHPSEAVAIGVFNQTLAMNLVSIVQ